MELPPALARQCSRPLPAGWPTGLLPSPLGTAVIQTLRRAPLVALRDCVSLALCSRGAHASVAREHAIAALVGVRVVEVCGDEARSFSSLALCALLHAGRREPEWERRLLCGAPLAAAGKDGAAGAGGARAREGAVVEAFKPGGKLVPVTVCLSDAAKLNT